MGAFVVIGMLSAAYGPLLPYLERTFHVSTAAAGALLTCNSLGLLAGMILTGLLDRRCSSRVLLSAALLEVAVGSLFFADATHWPMLLVGATLIGFGSGGIDVGVNQVIARGFGAASTTMTNLIHALFGVGAILAPVAVAAVNRHVLYGAATACAVALVPLVMTIGENQSLTPDASRSIAGPRLTSIRSLSFAAAYLFYLALESGIAAWEPSQLRHAGLSDEIVAVSASAYWVGLTVGRLGISAFARNIPASRITLIASAASLVALGGAPFSALAPFSYALAGLVIAPIYPSGLVWAAANDPSTRKFTAWLQVSSAIGATVFPSVIGFSVSGFGYPAVPYIMLILAALSLSCFLMAHRAKPENAVRARPS